MGQDKVSMEVKIEVFNEGCWLICHSFSVKGA